MERFRWPILFLGALVAGGVCVKLVNEDRIPDVIAISFMLILTGWFYLKDWEIDSYGA